MIDRYDSLTGTDTQCAGMVFFTFETDFQYYVMCVCITKRESFLAVKQLEAAARGVSNRCKCMAVALLILQANLLAVMRGNRKLLARIE